MESREREMHYKALAELKKEEHEAQEKEMQQIKSRGSFRTPSMPSMGRFQK